MKKTLIFIVLILIAIGAGVFLYVCEGDWCYVTNWQKVRAADSFERCVQLGFPVMESYPRQCAVGKKTFTEDIKVAPSTEPIIYKDLIKITSPTTNAVITSPVKVTGEARGNWYFEASFPVRVLDANGKELGLVPAQAKGEWMTTDYVPFEASIIFTTPTTKTGTVVFEKDNPSGLPEHDDSVSIPVKF